MRGRIDLAQIMGQRILLAATKFRMPRDPGRGLKQRTRVSPFGSAVIEILQERIRFLRLHVRELLEVPPRVEERIWTTSLANTMLDEVQDGIHSRGRDIRIFAEIPRRVEQPRRSNPAHDLPEVATGKVIAKCLQPDDAAEFFSHLADSPFNAPSGPSQSLLGTLGP